MGIDNLKSNQADIRLPTFDVIFELVLPQIIHGMCATSAYSSAPHLESYGR
jgi:hypothetical protein